MLDFGVTWDEDVQRMHGLVSSKYISNLIGYDCTFSESVDDLHEHIGRHYGVLTQLPAIVIERLFDINTPYGYYYLRHYIIFGLYCLGLLFFIKSLQLRFTNPVIVFCGALVFILSPRILGHAFFNPKDITLLAFYAIGLFTHLQYIKNPNLKSAFWHGLVCALAINARITGLVLPVLSFVFFTIDYLVYRKTNFNKWLLQILVFTSSFIVFTIALWPYLWENPWANFWEAFEIMKIFKWDGDVLIWNEFIKASKLPWYYIPSWILISVPPVYLLLGFLGGVLTLYRFVQTLKHKTHFFLLTDLTMGAFFIAPICAVIILNSTLYDGWRHLFFVYAPLAFLAAIGIEKAIQIFNRLKSRARYLIPIVIGIQFLLMLGFIVKYHPHQHTYFNPIAGNVFTRFDVEYWGASYKDAMIKLGEIANQHPDNEFYCLVANWPGLMNSEILSTDERKNVKYIAKGDYHFYITNYRFTYGFDKRDKFLDGHRHYSNLLFNIKVRGVPVIGVYQITDQFEFEVD